MKSMTGFGKSTVSTGEYELDVEIKSVNQRFLDIQLRMPREANSYELAIRQLIKNTLQRGRIELYVNSKRTSEGNKEVVIHWELIHQLISKLEAGMHEAYPTKELSLEDQISRLLNNSTYVEVVEKQKEDEHFGQLLLEVVEQAVEKVDDSRLEEGQKIQQLLTDYTLQFSEYVKELSNFVQLYEQDYREKFEAKLNEWLGNQVDESRLLTELAILLEKGDIHEELDRLAIHLDKLHELLNQVIPVGRELDFLIQEMNREVNTIGSKSSPIEIKNIVVQMKTVLEKIREQVQNVE